MDKENDVASGGYDAAEQRLKSCRDEVAKILEKHYGKPASFVLTFTLDESHFAAFTVGGDRPAALLALRGVLQPGVMMEGQRLPAMIDAEVGDSFWPVGWRVIDTLVALRSKRKMNEPSSVERLPPVRLASSDRRRSR